MRVVLLLALILVASVNGSCASETRTVEGGEVVPYETEDGLFIYLRVKFRFTLHMKEAGGVDEKVEEDIAEVMKTNAIGMIGSRISVFLLSRQGEYSLSEIERGSQGDHPEHEMIRQLRETLAAEESLEEVTVRQIRLSYEKMTG